MVTGLVDIFRIFMEYVLFGVTDVTRQSPHDRDGSVHSSVMTFNVKHVSPTHARLIPVTDVVAPGGSTVFRLLCIDFLYHK